MIDLIAEHQSLDIGANLPDCKRMKTGALIAFSCESRSDFSPRRLVKPELRCAAYAHDLGLAFQIADDLPRCRGARAALETGKAGRRRHCGPERPLSYRYSGRTAPELRAEVAD